MTTKDDLEVIFRYSKLGVKSSHDCSIKGWRRNAYIISVWAWRMLLMAIGAYLSIILYGN